MTDTLTGTVNNAEGQPFLEGNLFPMHQELTENECRVTGQVPAGLNGLFVRNGPNPMFEPMGRYHMFDGDGMLVGFRFDEGRVAYRNRWIRSKALQAEIRLGRNVYPGLSECIRKRLLHECVLFPVPAIANKDHGAMVFVELDRLLPALLDRVELAFGQM